MNEESKTSRKPRLLGEVRLVLRRLHYSPKTVESYIGQTLLGHKDVRTTMIYTHVVNRGPLGAISPLDRAG